MIAPDVDIAILGGGLAGLSLAERLAAPDAPALSVAVIEPRTGRLPARTWCFWRPWRHDLDDLVSARWRRWRIEAPGVAAEHEGGRFAYQAVGSAAFEARALDRIEGAPHVRVLRGVRAVAVRAVRGGRHVETSQGALTARRVVDARPPDPSGLDRAALVYAFLGAEVEAGSARFDSGAAMLMLDMKTDAAGFRFTTVLPLGPARALLRSVRITARAPQRELLEADFSEALARACGGDVRLRHREFAALPMTSLRTAPGESFLRIRRWAQAGARRLAEGSAPPSLMGAPWPSRVADRILLQTLQERLDRAPELFLSLARALPPDRFASFMSEPGRLSDAAAALRAVRSGRLAAA